MRIWSRIIDVLVCAFAGWTLCYQFVLLARWPAWLAIALGAGWLTGMAVWGIRHGRNSVKRAFDRHGWQVATALLLMAALVGLYAGCRSCWNDDFFSFYHRAAAQLARLDQPILAGDTAHTGGDLPGLSMMHAMTSLELVEVLAASLLGLDPVAFALWMGGVPLGLMVVVHALLLRRFGLSDWLAVAGGGISALFLSLDLWEGRCLGAAFEGGWSGKVALWTTLTPLIALYTLRCLARPTAARQVLLALSSVAAVGLTGSALFMVPLQIAGICLAYCAAHRWQRPRWRTVLRTLLSLAYCAAVVAALMAGLIAAPKAQEVWITGFPQTWHGNLALVWSTPWRAARDLAMVLALPLLTLPRPLGRYLTLISASLLLVCMSPLSGPLLIRLVLPGSYWRVIFLLPVVACSGLLAVLAFRRHETWRIGVIRAAAAAACTALVLMALDTKCLSRLVAVRPTLADKLPAGANRFFDQFAAQLSGRNILAPEELSAVLPMRLMNSRFEVTRHQQTMHLFDNAGRSPEGARRIAAQAALSPPSASLETAAALRSAVEENGVNSVICQNPGPGKESEVQPFIAQLPGSWKRAGGNDRYLLLLREDDPQEPRLTRKP